MSAHAPEPWSSVGKSLSLALSRPSLTQLLGLLVDKVRNNSTDHGAFLQHTQLLLPTASLSS